MNNDRGLLSGSITILIGAVIAIMALVRGPWQVWLLLGVFTLWGLWVVLILLLPYMQQARLPVQSWKLPLSLIMGKGGSTFGCRPLITHQQGQLGLSTVGAAHLLAVDWLDWVCYLV